MDIFAAMSESTLPIHFAQLQSYTNVIYRLAHARIFKRHRDLLLFSRMHGTRRKYATADENEKFLGTSIAGRKSQGLKETIHKTTKLANYEVAINNLPGTY